MVLRTVVPMEYIVKYLLQNVKKTRISKRLKYSAAKLEQLRNLTRCFDFTKKGSVSVIY